MGHPVLLFQIIRGKLNSDVQKFKINALRSLLGYMARSGFPSEMGKELGR